MSAVAVLFLCVLGNAVAVDQHAGANPIRKVVTMLQSMQTKISAEGEKKRKDV